MTILWDDKSVHCHNWHMCVPIYYIYTIHWCSPYLRFEYKCPGTNALVQRPWYKCPRTNALVIFNFRYMYTKNRDSHQLIRKNVNTFFNSTWPSLHSNSLWWIHVAFWHGSLFYCDQPFICFSALLHHILQLLGVHLLIFCTYSVVFTVVGGPERGVSSRKVSGSAELPRLPVQFPVSCWNEERELREWNEWVSRVKVGRGFAGLLSLVPLDPGTLDFLCLHFSPADEPRLSSPPQQPRLSLPKPLRLKSSINYMKGGRVNAQLRRNSEEPEGMFLTELFCLFPCCLSRPRRSFLVKSIISEDFLPFFYSKLQHNFWLFIKYLEGIGESWKS
jgi:hypothetical protein